ncbi:unnamed protein product, partial [Mesorhabditis spiculigera]
MKEIEVGASPAAYLEDGAIRWGNEMLLLSNILTFQPSSSDDGPRIQIITYETAPKNRRQERNYLLKFKSNKVADEWSEKLEAKLKRRIPPHLVDRKLRNRVLVLVNPYSGQKKAIKCWEEEAKPTLEKAKIDYDHRETEQVGHGTAIALECPIDRYDAVLIVSGDGLVAEFVNGLLLRKDRTRALKIPICHIPGGTSNALAAAVCFVCNEKFPAWNLFPREMTLMVARPRFMPLRLFRVDTEYNGSKPMFLSAAWGLIADIDIGSERFRWAGLMRLHMEAWIRVMRLPQTCKYRCRISYVPLGDEKVARKTLLKYDAARHLFGRDHFEYADIEPATGQEEILQEHFSSLDAALCDQESYEIPPLSEPFRWPLHPSSRLDDSFMYLALVEWGTIRNRFQIADLLVRMDGSNHLLNTAFQLIPVRACRIEPIGPQECSGYFAVDGEALKNNSKFQVVPIAHSATVIGRDEV